LDGLAGKGVAGQRLARDDSPTMPSSQWIVVAALAAVLFVPISLARAAEGDKPAAGGRSAKHPEIVGHRGEPYDAPENTMASFNLAWERHDDVVETDVHLTKDGKLIISHDFNTLRTTGGPRHGGQKLVIAEHTAEELRKLDVGKWKSPVYAGQKMPFLDELLATIPDKPGKRVFIEIKIGPEAAEPVVQAIKTRGLPPEYTAVISFNFDSCAAVKKLMPELQVYYLAQFKADKKSGKQPPTVDELIKMAKGANLDGLDLSYEGPLDAAGVKRIHDAGLKCHVWTIDDVAVAKKFAGYGVDGITTNRSAWLREQLGIADSKD
jgi:glycerophosphoryl diester phosphodiesterase